MEYNNEHSDEYEIQVLTTLADQYDNPYAQYVLASEYYNGDIVETDYEKAFEYYKKAADHNISKAQRKLADYYNTGFLVVEKNVAVGIQYLEKAASQGDKEALGRLANYCMDALGNIIEAEEYLKLLTDKDVLAQDRVGVMFFEGRYGVKRDVCKAEEYLIKAALGGEKEARDILKIHKDEFEKYKNELQKKEYHDFIIDMEKSISCYETGIAYLRGDGEIQKDEIKAVEMLKEAAELGNYNALYTLGFCYANGVGTEKVDMDKAFNCFFEATEKGHEKAPFFLALMYKDGDGVAPDKNKAFDYLIKAEDKGVMVNEAKLKMKEILKEMMKEITTEANDCDVWKYHNYGEDYFVQPTALQPIDHMVLGNCFYTCGYYVLIAKKTYLN